MASVQGSRALKYARRDMLDEEPPEHLETAGSLMIKELVQKQTNTKVTLRQQLLERKEFERGVGFVSPTQVSAGTTTLKEFQNRWKQAEEIEEVVRKKTIKEEISDTVTSPCQHDSDCGHGKQENSERVGRLERELAATEKPGSMESRLYQFAMQNMSRKHVRDTRPSDHPIHHLAAAAERLTETGDPKSLAKTYRRKRRQLAEAQEDPPWVHYKHPEPGKSLWDEVEMPEERLETKATPRFASCKKQNFYTIRDGEIVQISDSVAGVVSSTKTKTKSKLASGVPYVNIQDSVENSSFLKRPRLTEEEIKKLPRFQNYEKGKVSKTLFVKNLSRNISETDLVDIFGQFEEPSEGKIVYRLLTGKMKGQAFVSFPTCDKATIALEAVNGTMLKGKPIIIQFGKQQD